MVLTCKLDSFFSPSCSHMDHVGRVYTPSSGCLCAMLRCFHCIILFVTPWTVAHQAPLSMGFSRQEYWSELPCPPPWDLSDAEIGPMFLASPALASGFLTTGATREAPGCLQVSGTQCCERVKRCCHHLPRRGGRPWRSSQPGRHHQVVQAWWHLDTEMMLRSPWHFPLAPAWALMASLLSLFNLGSPFPAQSAKAEQYVEGQA